MSGLALTIGAARTSAIKNMGKPMVVIILAVLSTMLGPFFPCRMQPAEAVNIINDKVGWCRLSSFLLSLTKLIF
jgi:hypothetical protein